VWYVGSRRLQTLICLKRKGEIAFVHFALVSVYIAEYIPLQLIL